MRSGNGSTLVISSTLAVGEKEGADEVRESARAALAARTVEWIPPVDVEGEASVQKAEGGLVRPAAAGGGTGDSGELCDRCRGDGAAGARPLDVVALVDRAAVAIGVAVDLDRAGLGIRHLQIEG